MLLPSTTFEFVLGYSVMIFGGGLSLFLQCNTKRLKTKRRNSIDEIWKRMKIRCSFVSAKDKGL